MCCGGLGITKEAEVLDGYMDDVLVCNDGLNRRLQSLLYSTKAYILMMQASNDVMLKAGASTPDPVLLCP